MKQYIAALALTLVLILCTCALLSKDPAADRIDASLPPATDAAEPSVSVSGEPPATSEPTQPPETTEPSAATDPLPTDPNSVTVSHTPTVVQPGSTFSGLAPLDPITYTVSDPDNSRGLSTEGVDFSFGAARDGQPHWITKDNQTLFDSLDSGALAWDNKSDGKILYLTFDCGYEYKTLTSDILDILEEKDVPAAFFCTLGYLKDAPEVVARMISDGHIVGNHSATHPNCTTLSREQLAWEILNVENYLRVNFGYSSKYFRFPSGSYSHNALDVVDGVGYRSVFWSIAHADWDPENQPGVDVSFETVTSRLHPGAVILLHTTSPDNVAILADFIDYARDQGYEFRTLDDYPYWDG